MRFDDPKPGPAVALLTGAGGAIGKATAIHLAQQGWRLGLLGRTASKLDDTIDASAAVVGDKLYLRGWKKLYCIADTSKDK